MTRLAPLFASCLAFGLASTALVASANPIIGGTAAKKGDYPTVVAISIGGGALCSGTLIDPEWVITAAHCMDPSVVGVANQAAVTASTVVYFNTVNIDIDQGTMIPAKETFFDPGFDVNNLGSHDSGLVHLMTPYTATKPTPVNWLVGKAPVGITVTQVGFGTRQIGAQGPAGAEYVLTGQVSVSCSSVGAGDDANLLCFNQTNGKGKCEGDSGGPSFAMLNGVQTLVGITSFGDQNCAQFGADTRPEAERDFLLGHVPNIECNDATMCAGSDECFNHACIVSPFSPMGVGAPCTGAADCQSKTCAGGPGTGSDLCVISCTPGTAGTCPDGFDCLASGTTGACWPTQTASGGGCCDAGNHGVPTMLVGIGLFALVLRRKRR